MKFILNSFKACDERLMEIVLGVRPKFVISSLTFSINLNESLRRQETYLHVIFHSKVFYV